MMKTGSILRDLISGTRHWFTASSEVDEILRRFGVRVPPPVVAESLDALVASRQLIAVDRCDCRWYRRPGWESPRSWCVQDRRGRRRPTASRAARLDLLEPAKLRDMRPER